MELVVLALERERGWCDGGISETGQTGGFSVRVRDDDVNEAMIETRQASREGN